VNEARSESGFTLIEVTLATVITGLIVGAIAAALIVMLNTYPSSANRLAQSDNAELLSSWLVPDVQSTSGSDATPSPGPPFPGIQIPSSPTPTTSIIGCGIVPLSTSVVKFSWSDAANPGVWFVADYRLAGHQLTRWYCQGGSPPSPTVVGRDIALAQAKQTMDSVDVTVQTTQAIADARACGTNQPPCFRFDVVVSRRTPALRISAQPLISINYVNAWVSDRPTPPISGTAEPNQNNMVLTITDQGTPSHQVTISNIQAGTNGNWSITEPSRSSLSFCKGASGSCDLVDLPWSAFNEGLLTYQLTTPKDPYGNQSTATTTTIKDMTRPAATVSLAAGQASPATAPSLRYLVTFTKPVTDLTSTGISVTAPAGDTPTWTVSKVDAQHFTVVVNGLPTANDTGDGNVRVSVNANAVTALDGSQNPNTASPPSPPIVWDAHTPPTVRSLSATPTSDSTIQYLVTFPPLATGTQLTANDLTATSSTVSSVQSVPCPLGTLTNYQCFDVTASVTLSSPGTISLSVNDGTAGKVLDKWGLPTPLSSSTSVSWQNAPLTIMAAPASGSAAFSGTGSPAQGDSPVTVDVCTDQTCTAPPAATANAPVDPLTGNWRVPSHPLPAKTYWARATQTQSGQPLVVFTGPFVVS
jgi:hypothetical protein